jgi:hypothetical protein
LQEVEDDLEAYFEALLKGNGVRTGNVNGLVAFPRLNE